MKQALLNNMTIMTKSQSKRKVLRVAADLSRCKCRWAINSSRFLRNSRINFKMKRSIASFAKGMIKDSSQKTTKICTTIMPVQCLLFAVSAIRVFKSVL